MDELATNPFYLSMSMIQFSRAFEHESILREKTDRKESRS